MWKGPTIEWSCREKKPMISFRGHEDLSHYIKSGRMSGMMVLGKTFCITKLVLLDDIHDIQDPKSHEASDILLTCTWVCLGWMALRGRNPSPSRRATLNLQSTCHGPRSGLKLACGVPAGSMRATDPRARWKSRGRKRKKCRMAKTTHLNVRTRFQMTWGVWHSFNLYVGLLGPVWFYVLGIPPLADVRLWTSRARATDLGQGSTLPAGSRRAPCVRRSREHDERAAAGRAKKNAEWPKQHI